MVIKVLGVMISTDCSMGKEWFIGCLREERDGE